MDEEKPSPADPVFNRKMPVNHQSRISAVLSEGGNWGLVGSAPYMGMQLYEKATHQHNMFSKNQLYAAWTVIGVGAVYGAFAGLRKAAQLDDYRDTISAHVDALTAEVKGDRMKIAELTKAVEAKEQGAARA